MSLPRLVVRGEFDAEQTSPIVWQDQRGRLVGATALFLENVRVLLDLRSRNCVVSLLNGQSIMRAQLRGTSTTRAVEFFDPFSIETKPGETWNAMVVFATLNLRHRPCVVEKSVWYPCQLKNGHPDQPFPFTDPFAYAIRFEPVLALTFAAACFELEEALERQRDVIRSQQ